MRKCKQILSFFLVMLMILQSTVSMAFADTVDVSSGSNAGNSDTSFEASAAMLGGGLVVIIPDEVPLTFDSTSNQFTNDSNVIAKGYIEVGKHLEVSVPTDIEYSLDLLNSIKADGTVTFGSTEGDYQVTEWSREELKTKDINNIIKGVSKSFNVSVPKSNIFEIGNYSSVINFYINLVDGDETATTMMYLMGYEYVDSPSYTDNDDSIQYEEVSNYSAYSIMPLSDDDLSVGDGYELKAFKVVDLDSDNLDAEIAQAEAELQAEGCEYVVSSQSSTINVPEKVNGFDVIGVSLKEFFNNEVLSEYVTNINLPSSVKGIELADINVVSNASTVIISENYRVSVNLSSLLPANATIMFVGDIEEPDDEEPDDEEPSNPDLDMDDPGYGIDVIEDIPVLYSRDNEVLATWGDLGSAEQIYNENVAFQAYPNATKVVISGSIPDGYIMMNYFKNHTGLETAIVFEGAGDLQSAFQNCTNLKNVVLPEGLTNLYRTFYGCTGLEEITIPEGVSELNETFWGCTNLTSVTLPNSVTVIEESTFKDCVNLEDIELPENLTYIGKRAFENAGLTKIVIPDTVTSIDEYAFLNCGSLEYVGLSNGLEEIGNNAFYDCDSLKVLVIPDGVTTIGNHAFSDCSVLADVVIPDSVTSIGKGAFLNCENLFQITWRGMIFTDYEVFNPAVMDEGIATDGYTWTW